MVWLGAVALPACSLCVLAKPVYTDMCSSTGTELGQHQARSAGMPCATVPCATFDLCRDPFESQCAGWCCQTFSCDAQASDSHMGVPAGGNCVSRLHPPAAQPHAGSCQGPVTPPAQHMRLAGHACPARFSRATRHAQVRSLQELSQRLHGLAVGALPGVLSCAACDVAGRRCKHARRCREGSQSTGRKLGRHHGGG